MDPGRDDDATGPDAADPVAPAHSTGWVARRLGVSPATLRTWHRRYRIGPTGRTAGGHRRYLVQDLERLERMRRLVLAGVPTAEAARASAPHPAPPARGTVGRVLHRTAPPGRRSTGSVAEVRRLTRAALALDQAAAAVQLGSALDHHGVGPTWTQLVVPVLARLGERWARSGDSIDVEHLFSETVRTALAAVTTTTPLDGVTPPPVLLACLEHEDHNLALHALAAALAELDQPSRVLGAVPAEALVSAARRIAPRVVFVWAQTPATARPADLHGLPHRRPPTPTVVGGPGWRDQVLPPSVTRVDSLAAAVAAAVPGGVPPAGPAADR